MVEEVIPVLRVADAAAAVRWYERLGFTKQWEHRFEPECPAFVSIAHGRARLYLSEHRGDARPDTLVHLAVGDIDAVVAEFGPPGGEQPYGCTMELRDPDGNRLRISPLAHRGHGPDRPQRGQPPQGSHSCPPRTGPADGRASVPESAAR